jgi:hypothetical protein
MPMKARTKRWWSRGLLVLGLLWLCFVGYIGWAMRQPPEVFGHVMSRMPMPAYFLFPFETMWTHARKGTLRVGDTAPGLTVQTLDTQQTQALSALWKDRPVVLVFGSYT